MWIGAMKKQSQFKANKANFKPNLTQNKPNSNPILKMNAFAWIRRFTIVLIMLLADFTTLKGAKANPISKALKCLLVYMFYYPIRGYAGIVWLYLNQCIFFSRQIFQKFRRELRQIYSFFIFSGFGIMKPAKKINRYPKANNDKQSNNIYRSLKPAGHKRKLHRLYKYIKRII